MSHVIAKPDPSRCAHDDNFDLEWEGFENATEPLQIVVTCTKCDGQIRVVVQDVSLKEWKR